MGEELQGEICYYMRENLYVHNGSHSMGEKYAMVKKYSKYTYKDQF